jgi:hypothetical protein
MRQLTRVGIGFLSLLICFWYGASPASAGYFASGYDLKVVQSQKGLVNGAVNYQTNGLWSVSGRDVPLSTSFAGYTADNIKFARLYVDVWGGTPARTAQIEASVNGTALPTVNFGGTSDSNPTYDSKQICVYGSGAGAWQIGFSGIDHLLKKDGTANTVSFTVSDPNNNLFDGRTYAASLVSVYTHTSNLQTLDYYLAEADGTLRNAPGTYGSPSQRSLVFSALDLINVDKAIYQAGYTHGNPSGTNKLDQLYFNGSPLGPADNDLTKGDSDNQGVNNLMFDVTNLLNADSTVRYSVDSTELGGAGDSYLRAHIGLLSVLHPVPEPSTLVMLASGGLGMLIYLARRRKQSEAKSHAVS